MTTAIEPTKYIRTTRLPSGEIDGELMALDAKGGEILGLDRIGTQIWTLAAKPVGIDQLVDWACLHHDVSRDDARRDIAQFLDELLACGLIEPAA